MRTRYPLAALTLVYAVFLVLAARGHVEWSRSLRAARAAAVPAGGGAATA
jgi:uncharacterized membrane protein